MNPAASAIRSLFLDGPAGGLEALLNSGAENATHAALVSHPHPMFGGTMHNKVVFHAMKALNRFGFPVLRFNFRGTGLSHGEHDHGRGETDDALRPGTSAVMSWIFFSLAASPSCLSVVAATSSGRGRSWRNWLTLCQNRKNS